MSIVTHLTWTQGDLSGREIGLDLMSSGRGSWPPLWWKRGAPSHTELSQGKPGRTLTVNNLTSRFK